MRICLRNDREVAIELRMQATKRDVLAQTTVLEARATQIVRLDLASPVFRHQDDLKPVSAKASGDDVDVPGSRFRGLLRWR